MLRTYHIIYSISVIVPYHDLVHPEVSKKNQTPIREYFIFHLSSVIELSGYMQTEMLVFKSLRARFKTCIKTYVSSIIPTTAQGFHRNSAKIGDRIVESSRRTMCLFFGSQG